MMNLVENMVNTEVLQCCFIFSFADFTSICHFSFLFKFHSVENEHRTTAKNDTLSHNNVNSRSPRSGEANLLLNFRKIMHLSKLLWSFLTLLSSSRLFLMPFESLRTFCPLLCIQPVICFPFLISVLFVSDVMCGEVRGC